MKTKLFILLFTVCALAFNCSSSSDDDNSGTPNPNPDPDPQPNEKVTYDADIKSILTSNCISCHGSTPTQNAPMSLTTYSQAKNYIDGIIDRINRTGAGKMPPSGQLSTAQKQAFEQWKTDGLLEN
ncbi:c-type cytochrome [Gaetbulibacter saemankumensis]|uniref:c-type cytochrome n=1 Tax=Gaetbulibacter saemankumensis TaxID=311208 RepID=UPI0003F8D6BA|nr:c-type cytochrome [Gaetbulibacter saemankumensis]